MNLSDIKPHLPPLRVLSYSRITNRGMSCRTSSKSTHSLSSFQSKTCDVLPFLLQLCIYSDEQSAYESVKNIFSSRWKSSPNVCDQFGCNVLMYTLRYHRYQLFHFLLDEIAFDLNFKSTDRQGNTVLHYAVIYARENGQILEKLIEIFNKFGISTDERNIFGFTPLLLASFCGRYDLVLNFLTKTDASPFVRDYIQSKNLLDYLEMDRKRQDSMRRNPHTEQSFSFSRESTRLRVQMYHTLPPSTPSHPIHQHPYKNFFETILPQAVQDRSGSIRSSILQIFAVDYSSNDLNGLIQYINRRYPRINTASKQCHTTKLVLQRENSKTNVHEIFNLFDPNLRSKAVPPKPVIPPQLKTTGAKAPSTFKRVGTKLTVLAALSRSQPLKKSANSLTTTYAK